MATPSEDRCPRCKELVRLRLAAGEVCPHCRSSAAWERYAGEVLRIDHAAVEEWSARRARDERRARLRRRLALVPVLSAPPLALLAVLGLWSLLGSRPFQPLEEYRGDYRFDAWSATLAGALALGAGAMGRRWLHRSAWYRSRWLHVCALSGGVLGLPALLLGALISFGLGSGDWEHGRMPALADAPDEGSQVELIRRATAVILAPERRAGMQGLAIGAGAVIHVLEGTCWIVTCSHVVMPYAAVAAFRDAAQAMPVWVYFADGREARGQVSWTAQPPLDVALIAVQLDDPPAPVPIATDTLGLRAETRVLAVPNPFRQGWKTLRGSVLRRELHATTAGEYDLLYTDLPVQPGDSGTGLFDASGSLVGLNTWAATGPEGHISISLPSETMRTILTHIQLHGRPMEPTR